MRLREIMRFRRTSADVVPIEVLRSIGLPMPDDVLEQFVHDHGTKWEFQNQYGDLDLHAIQWSQQTLPASDILACSVYPQFREHVTEVADRTRAVRENGWADMCFLPSAVVYWQQYGTWMRSPIMLRGESVGSAAPLHLVEGHSRTGALRGLVESGVLPLTSTHEVWVGEVVPLNAPDERWRELLRTERMPFLNWLMGRVGDDGEIGEIASLLINIQYSSMSRVRIEGDNLDAIVEFASKDAALRPMINTITAAHVTWERFVGG